MSITDIERAIDTAPTDGLTRRWNPWSLGCARLARAVADGVCDEPERTLKERWYGLYRLTVAWLLGDEPGASVPTTDGGSVVVDVRRPDGALVMIEITSGQRIANANPNIRGITWEVQEALHAGHKVYVLWVSMSGQRRVFEPELWPSWQEWTQAHLERMNIGDDWTQTPRAHTNGDPINGWGRPKCQRCPLLERCKAASKVRWAEADLDSADFMAFTEKKTPNLADVVKG